MSGRETLHKFLLYLGRLLDEPTSLSPSKSNAVKLDAARLEARGWKYLAGYSTENVDELISLIGDQGMSTLLRHRRVPESNGRRVGSKEEKYISGDALVLADIARGVKKHIAIYRQYPIRKQYRTHARRIDRDLARIDAETREIIALQTVDIK
jgi:hypothetical protein